MSGHSEPIKHFDRRSAEYHQLETVQISFLTFQLRNHYVVGMNSEMKNLVPPPQHQPVNPFKCAGRIAMALALALTIIIGPSQITAAAPELNSAPVKVQYHHDNQANADHNSTDSAESGHHSAAIKVYCNTATRVTPTIHSMATKCAKVRAFCLRP